MSVRTASALVAAILALLIGWTAVELWNRGDWETRREALLARSSEIALRAKQARQSP